MQMQSEDDVLISAIRSHNDRKRDWALYSIYNDPKYKEVARKYVLNHRGVESDVDDVFQDAIVLFDRNVRNGLFKGESSLSTYFMGIIKWTWIGIQRRRKVEEVELDMEIVDSTSWSNEFVEFTEEKKHILDLAVNLLNEKCKMLLGYYRLDHTMKEIAVKLGYSSPEMAKKQAYRCREKLKTFFEENKEYREVFYNY